MKYKWLSKKQNNEKLLYFFNGWGMDERALNISNIFSNFDVLMFYDYQNLDMDENVFVECQKYKNKYLISWSMGVMISSIFSLKLGKLDKKIAINGTIKPIDDNFGILKKIYDLTIKGFNQSSCEKFVKRMFVETTAFSPFLPKRTLEELKNELISLKTYKGDENFSFDLVYISEYDKIITPKNQLNFWNKRNEKILMLDCGHFPTSIFENLNESLLSNE